MLVAAGRRQSIGGLIARARQPVDLASLSVLRFLWGAILLVGLLRFMANGWVHVQYVQPTFFFKYPGFAWTVVPAPPLLYALFFATALCALGVALGAFYRWSALGFALGFTYIQLLDVTNYLNHYYLVVLLAWWFVFLPLNGSYSIDAWRARRRGRPLPTEGPRLWLWLLRAQIAIVYVSAALAKFHPDWLLHAQPLGIWMNARTETPLIGPLLDEVWLPYAMSWAGFLYDLTIVFWLSWRRTRPFAFGCVLGFHALTHVFFDIGLFPFLMTAAATVFFSSHWPRRFLGAAKFAPRATRPSRGWIVVVSVYLALQFAVPLRHFVLPGDVLWGEDGMRLAWKVMVREKNGSVTYHVEDRTSSRRWIVSPHDYLTWRQANEMSAQPDLIVQLARHIAWDFAQRGHDVSVRAEAWASLNGRPRALLLDPEIDLARFEARVTAMPTTPPLKVR